MGHAQSLGTIRSFYFYMKALYNVNVCWSVKYVFLSLSHNEGFPSCNLEEGKTNLFREGKVF